MNVLIVDDQINVVNGIFFGVDWKKIGIRKVRKAYHALEAKDILLREQIHILLCDIEMPEESGIELFSWMKEQEIPTECIFLTAHADFIYAKQAMQLGGFDYILQPARYEDIELSITRAIQKIKKEREIHKYYAYGKMLYHEKDRMLESLISDWLLNGQKEPDTLLADLSHIDITIQNDRTLFTALIQFIYLEDEEWEDALIRYSLHNMLSELFTPHGQELFLTTIKPREQYCLILYPKGTYELSYTSYLEIIRYFQETASVFWGCGITCYTQDSASLSNTPEHWTMLENLLTNNVGLQTGVICPAGDAKTEPPFHLSSQKAWAALLLEGHGETVRNQAFSLLDEMMQRRHLSAHTLKLFHQEFLKLLYTLCEEQKIALNQIFPEEENLEKILHAYQNVDEIKEMIRYVTACFHTPEQDQESMHRQLTKIKEYIYQNLDKDIRREELAKAVYLNPSYLSRLFKKEEGVSLKEFITAEKMKMAQSLLRTTALPISMVAAKVGYQNFSHFSQTYKKIIGNSPTDERRQES